MFNNYYVEVYKEIAELLTNIPEKIIERDMIRNNLYDFLSKIEEIKIKEAGEIAITQDVYTGKDKKEYLTQLNLEKNEEYQKLINKSIPDIRILLSEKEANLYAMQNKLTVLISTSQTLTRIDSNTGVMITGFLMNQEKLFTPETKPVLNLEEPIKEKEPTIQVSIIEDEEEIEVTYDVETFKPDLETNNIVNFPESEESQHTEKFLILETRKTRGMGSTRAYCENTSTKERIAMYADNPAGMMLKSSINKIVFITYIPVNGDGKVVSVEEIKLN